MINKDAVPFEQITEQKREMYLVLLFSVVRVLSEGAPSVCR